MFGLYSGASICTMGTQSDGCRRRSMPMTPSPKIFISYRRDDAPGSTGRLYDRLADSFPREALFMDVDAMVPGVDFVRELDEAVQDCDVLLAVIGRHWLDAAAPSGARRLDDPEDFVRIEVETALKQRIRVIPVLVDGAQMPAAEELPEPLKPLARRHAVEISHSRFASDADRLVRAFGMDETAASPPAQTQPLQAAPQAQAVPRAATDLNAVTSAPVSRWRVAGAAFTVWAIVASGAYGNLAAAPGPAYWLDRAGMEIYLWAGFNVMIGPALALKIWLPRFAMAHFWGVVGATFAALATLIGSQYLFTTFLLPDVPLDATGTVEAILNMGLREIPQSLLCGVVLGYFLSQALGGWFGQAGGRGFVVRTIVIWSATGTAYGIANFLLIVIMEAAVAVGSGAEAALIARADARMWSDTAVYGAAWALGFWLTLSFGPRRAAAETV